jgi:hypothetical protein
MSMQVFANLFTGSCDYPTPNASKSVTNLQVFLQRKLGLNDKCRGIMLPKNPQYITKCWKSGWRLGGKLGRNEKCGGIFYTDCFPSGALSPPKKWTHNFRGKNVNIFKLILGIPQSRTASSVKNIKLAIYLLYTTLSKNRHVKKSMAVLLNRKNDFLRYSNFFLTIHSTFNNIWS